MINQISAKVLNKIKTLSEGKLVSLIAYGSHIAGYAKKESDYDFLAVIDDFREKIRYFYLKLDGTPVALLVVDKKCFEEDVKNAILGEFVSGRLCTVYDSVINREYAELMEITYKTRVIREELSKLKSEFRKLLAFMEIPIHFFLYKKLKERITYYPPVRYSYIKMFFGEQAEKNTKRSIEGFLKAAEILSRENIIRLKDRNTIKIKRYESIPTQSELLYHLRFVKRAVKSYLTHIRAGKVPPSVFFYELVSKSRRAFECVKTPKELKNPKDLLKLTDNILFCYDDISLPDLMKITIGKEISDLTIKRIHTFLSTLFRVTVNIEGKHMNFAYKKYTDVGSVKWLPVELYAFPIANFLVLPKDRMVNEFLFNRILRKKGVLVPEIFALVWKSNSILMEFIDSPSLPDCLPKKGELSPEQKEIVRNCAKLMARIHSEGICLVDSKPQNMLIKKPDQIYITDLEQARVNADKSWDIALFIFYSLKFNIDKKRTEDIVKSFIDGYLEIGDRDIIRNSACFKYTRIFLPIVPVNTLKIAVNLLRKA